MSARILVVEDEAAICDAIGLALSRAGIAYELASDAEEAQQLIEAPGVSLLLLDWMLPGMSGIEFAEMVKSSPRTASLPIIMLTARGEEEDKVRGFDIGVDDYITKPFSPRELVARIRAVLRRAGSPAAEVIQHGDLILDAASYRVHVRDAEVQLSATEFEILRVLMNNPDRVYTRAQLLEFAWPRNVHVGERTVDVHVSSLRKALEPLECEDKIQTVRGVGYRFSAQD